MRPIVRWFLERYKHRKRRRDRFLASCTAVIHVGAHIGQEREKYQRYGLDVLWIEPMPDVFVRLIDNIRPFPRQRAVNALIADTDDQSVPFYVSSNNGASSSIFEFHRGKEIWPEISFERHVDMTTLTLPSAMQRAGIDRGRYDALIMDTQGSELLVLKGASTMLGQFKYILTEAADFEAYKGCATEGEITDFLAGHGFVPVASRLQVEMEGVGRYSDVLFGRRF